MIKYTKVILLLFAVGAIWTVVPGDRTGSIHTNAAWAAEASPDIQWFKEEMLVSQKYLPKEEGIFGVSWAHFLTMAFLVIFFLGTLIQLYIRSRRTEEILTTLLKEDEHHGSQG